MSEANPSTKEDDTSWRTQSNAWRTQLGVPFDFHPFTTSKGFVGKGLHGSSKRTFDMVDCTAMEHCKRFKCTVGTLRQHVGDLLLDYSQAHVRRPYSNKQGVARTLTTSSTLYHFGQDRVLTGLEHLLLQGYDIGVNIPEGMSQAELKKCAGEGISLPVLGSVVWALYMAGTLPKNAHCAH